MAPPPPIHRSGRAQPPSRRLELGSDLFSLSTHPTQRLLAVGESSGRVGVWGWPEEEDVEDKDDDDEEEEEKGRSGDDSDGEDTGRKPKVLAGRVVIPDEQWWQQKWSAKRHKGSTRCVRFSGDGEGKPLLHPQTSSQQIKFLIRWLG